ncbi:MAG TPA: hypothetical protein VFN61_00625 [Acidimicrobiales bacterium]|nr:hypothetical protein [Acidimicrobiales bacterium]
MAAVPLRTLVLKAASVADDLGFVALADVASACAGTDALIIGGHMVQLHVYRWGLGAALYRETLDADVGMSRLTAKDTSVTDRLRRDLGYERTHGNVFERDVPDIPVAAPPGQPHRAVVELLVPAYTSRARRNFSLGDHLTTTEVPGLAEALKCPPVVCQLKLARLNGQVLETNACLPDEVSALVLKVLVWRKRLEARDAVDIWRCTEVLMAAGINLSRLTGQTAASVREYLRSSVADRKGPFVTSIVRYRGLSANAGDALHTRLRATIAALTATDHA